MCEVRAMKGYGARGLVVVMLVAVVSGGCVGAGVSPSASATTAVPGWEHFFRLEWAPYAHGGGTAIDGYIYNGYISPVANVQILAQALDAGNNVVAQRLEWVPRVVPALDRSYFRVAALPPADRYRVSVWAFDVVEAPTSPHDGF
jgi:hypothetical protein